MRKRFRMEFNGVKQACGGACTTGNAARLMQQSCMLTVFGRYKGNDFFRAGGNASPTAGAAVAIYNRGGIGGDPQSPRSICFHVNSVFLVVRLNG